MTIVSLACQLNKNHGDTDIYRTSVTECVKGATIRIPSAPVAEVSERKEESRKGRRGTFATSRADRGRTGPLLDQRTGRLTSFGLNLVTFLIVGYLLGGLVLGPALGFRSCGGLSPCEGSVIGLALSGFGSLAYTYYYFVKKV